MKKLSLGLLLMLAFLAAHAQYVVKQTFTTSGSFTVPAGVTSITVEAWGGGSGGSGGGNGGAGVGSGGGGGAYSKSVIPVIPGNSYPYQIGIGGPGGIQSGSGGTPGASGGQTYFIDASTLLAQGGISGNPGTGGLSSAGVGTVKFSGGSGGIGAGGGGAGGGGGGGSSAGTSADGVIGLNASIANGAVGGTAPSGGGNGGKGGDSGVPNASAGSVPGGGGGGGSNNGGGSGGTGANGQIAISYTHPGFITTWVTTDGTITIPTTGGGYNYDVIWSNVTNPGVSEGSVTGQTGNYTITGLQNGSTYRVFIAGAFPRIYFNGGGDRLKIKTIDQWGNIAWTSMVNAFNTCTNLTYNAIDSPDLTNVTSLNSMFLAATSFNGDLSNWNTATITDMAGTFYGTSSFNGNISSWNTANVSAMNSMFDYATSFNGNISGWNTSSVTSMGYMFEGATSFNNNISGWNTASVIIVNDMFIGATAFNQNLGSWNVSSIINGGMTNMLSNSGLSTDNYDATLSGWAAQTVLSGLSLGASGLTYCNAVARHKLTAAPNNWTITDAGQNAGCPYIPQVSSPTPDGTYGVGSVIPVQVTFNTAVIVVGTPTITLETGTTDRVINYTSGSGTTTLTFNYTVQSGDTSPDLDYIAWSLTAGTSIKDANAPNYNASLSLSTPGAIGSLGDISNIVIDGTPSTGFITTWKTDNPGTSSSNQITIPTNGCCYNYTVNWGDGQTSSGVTGDITHTYAGAGTYTVSIVGTFPRIYFANTGDRQKLLTVEQWGNIAWTSMNQAFQGCSNLNVKASDVPDLSNLTDLGFAFLGVPSFNTNMNGWDVSNVNTMSIMFFNSGFNQDISGWDVSSVTSMDQMFESAGSFNQDISSWNVSNVINMYHMFWSAVSFNANISGWNVSSATSMNGMFFNATSFNQNLSSWNVGNVTNMPDMFNGASLFNQSLATWNISKVTNMANMLDNSGLATNNYDATLAGWAAQTLKPNVTLGAAGLTYCDQADRGVLTSAPNNWTITDAGQSAACPVITSVSSSTTDGTYGIGAVISITATFNKVVNVVGTPTITLETGTTDRVINYTSGSGTAILTFDYTVQTGDISADLDYISAIALALNAGTIKDVSGNDAILTLATPGAAGSLGATKAIVIVTAPSTGFITTWKTDNAGTSASNQITIPTNGCCYNYTVNWGDGQTSSGVTGNITHTYASAGTYTVSISGAFPTIYFNNAGDKSKILSIEQWGDIIWTDMTNSFYGCSNLTHNATDAPNLTNVTSLFGTFKGASSFNGDLSNWNVSKITTMYYLFEGATLFNGNITNWDVSKVQTMIAMFVNGTSFNQDISGWNVSAATAMESMFNGATAFNQDLSAWDVSGVSNMNLMFNNATSFNQSLGSWDISSLPPGGFNMLDNSGISIANYDATLIGWATLDVGETKIPTGVILGSNGLSYCSSSTERAELINTYSWTIIGDTPCPLITSVSSSNTDGPYGIGSVISITVLFNKVVNVVGTPTITLETGATDRVVNYTGGSGTNTLTFDYTVQAGDVSADLNYLSTNALALNAGTIKDVTNNDAILTLAVPGAAGSLGASKAIVIDGIVPVAPSIPDLDVADDIGLSNTDNITANDASLTLSGTAEAGSTITFTESGLGILGTAVATGGIYTFDFDIGSGTYSITATAQDAAGNNSPASGGLTITVDTGNPNVTINQSVSQTDPASTVPVSFDVVFNKAVNPATFTSADITLGGTALGQSVTSLTNPLSDNINWILTITATGDGTIIPSIGIGVLEDVAGNTNTASTSADNTITYLSCVNPTLTITPTPNTTCSPFPSNGSASVSVSPAGTYTYQWFDASLNPLAVTTSSISGLAAGNYSVTATNTSGGCSTNTSVTILDASVLPSLTVSSSPNTACNANYNGSILISASVPATGYNYVLTGPLINDSGTISGSSTTLSNLPDGTYTVEMTNNDTGCAGTTNVTIFKNTVFPNAPAIGVITQPTCIVPTGSVALSGLPAGAWTINPGVIAGSGTTTTLTLLAPATTFNYTVTDASTGCISPASANVVINAVPVTATPVVGTITQPTCTVPTGSVALSGLPAGAWIINPGAIAGSGTTTTLTSLTPATTFNYTVTDVLKGCVSAASVNVVINAILIAATPIVGTITQPTCATPTGSVILSGLPAGAWTINPGAIAGSGATTTLTSLTPSTTFNYTVTDASTGCISPASANVVINAIPTAATPIVGAITQPTCTVPTGSVALSGLPAGAWTINPGAIAGSGATTTLTLLTSSTTFNYTVTETATGCTSVASANVVINAVPASPSAPTTTVTTQPTCIVPTGTITVTFPANGAGVSYTVTGTSPVVAAQNNATGIFTGLAAGNYDVTTTVNGCTSTATALTVNVAPGAPTAPIVGTITQPTCTIPTGSVALSGLPSGSWTINPGSIAGTGTTTTLTSLNPATTFNYTVTETATGCTSGASANVVINAVPTATTPIVGTITQPTCTVPTGSVALSGLPAGAWTINPGAIAGSGPATTLTLLTPSTTFNYTVTDASTGCISPASANVVINAIPTAAAPIVGTITQPTCTVPTGSVALSGLPAGAWTINPGAIAGSGATTTLTLLTSSTTFNYTVTETATGCISAASANVVINAVPTTTAPIVGTITQPTCTVTTGSVALSGLPAGAWTINPGAIAGSGTTTTLIGLASITHNFTVTETATGCISVASANVVINAVPTAATPIVGTITQPTCTIPTGSVALSGLPAGAWTINPGTIAGSGATTTLSGLAPSTTFTYTVTETATGCISGASANVVINAVPTAATPIVGTITQPTCTVPTGSVALSGLPAGAWTINPGAIAGSGATTTLTLLTPATTFNYTVTETATGCLSTASANVVVNAVPTATTPIVGTITQPTCTVPTGSVALSGLPAGAWTINPGAIAGSGTTTTLIGLASITHNFNVTETATGCTSVASANVVINAAPVVPSAPTASVTTQPTCLVAGTITVTVPAPAAGVSYTVTGTSPVVAAQNNTTGIFTGLAAGNYDVTTTVNGCISVPTALVVNVAAGAPASPIVGTITQPTCTVPTGSVALSGLPAGAWTINPGAIAGSGTTTTLTLLTPSATFNYTVTETATGCISAASANVVINAVPTAATPIVGTITQPTCTVPTGSVALSGLPAGAWTINPGAIAGSGTTTTLTLLTPSTTFNYTVTETATGCISVASANIVINAIPTATVPIVGTITQPTCTTPTGGVALSGLPAGAWTINPGAVAGSGTTTTLTLLTPATTFNYTVTSTVNGCTSVSSANVVINAVPTTTAPIVGTITQPTCNAPTGSVALGGLPAGAWTINPGAIAGSGATATLTLLTPSTTFNYTVTETTTGCISGASANIVINAVPTTTAPIVGTITQPTCTTPTGSVGLSGLPLGAWTINPGAIAGSGATTILTLLTPSTTFNYTVTETATGCISTASANVVFNAIPTAAIPIVGTITQPTCTVPTGSVALSGLPAGAWTINPGAVAGSGTTTTLTLLTPSTTFNYTVTETATGCISGASANVVINAVPTSPAAPTATVTTQPTCIVPTGTLTVTVPANGVGVSYTVTGTSPVVAAQNNTTGFFTGLAAGNYDVTTTVNGCISSATALTVNVAPGAPATPIVGTITQPTCTTPTGSVALSGLPAGAWTINPGAIAGSGVTTTLILLTPSTIFNYTVTETATGCTSVASANVVINAVPAAPAAPTASVTTQPTCSVATGTITVTVPANGTGVSYTVTGTSPVVASQSNATGIFSALATGNYNVTTTVGGCSSAATALTINPQPATPAAPTASVTAQPTCSIATGTITVTVPANGTGISYTISGTSPVVAAQSNATGIFSGLASGNYNVTTTVSGCTSTATALIINSIPNPPVIAVASVTIADANIGSSNGSIALTGAVTGGSGTYIYQWYTGSGITAPIVGAVNASITNLAAGNYTVVATDAVSGCSTTPQIFTVKAISSPTVTSINYQVPTASPTNANSLTFRVTFSVSVVNVDAADFTKTVSGVSTGTTTVSAITGAIYDVTFPVAGNGTVRIDVLSTASIADGSGNAYLSNFITGQLYTVDQIRPVFSATAPTSNSTVNNTVVSYTLSEALSSGTITWTRTGGAADAASPHIQTLVGGELTVGPHTNITLTNSPTLVPGTFYSVTFSGVDLAGNSSTPAVETSITFTPVAGNLSDIVASSSFSYPQNINYASFQEAGDIQNSSTSLPVAKFDIRDGGASGNDTDPFPTILTGITLDLGSNFSVIRRIALYDESGNTELAGTDKDVSSQKISFSNLSISSDDNASASFTIRVSFVQKVTDNQQFSFTITAASSQASNSGFASANASGAVSSTSNNNNRIEVIASKLRFVQEPSNTIVNEVMTPAVAVEALDVNGNLDLDFSGSVNLTSLGSLSSNPTISMTSGAGTSSDITFSAAGTALTLTTTNSSSLANATSAAFDIYDDTEGIELIINSFITPNTADDQNNVLYIENIEFFPENTVKLIDRWGVPIKSWTNFVNYGSSDAEQADFDFTSLGIGNYICIVEYKSSANGDKKSQTQMISVLK